jgi:ABC-type uncharacterized transport system permease subunit
VTLGSIAVWGAFLLAGCFVHARDFTTGIANWFTLVIVLGLMATAGLLTAMEMRRRRVPEAFSGSAGDTL